MADHPLEALHEIRKDELWHGHRHTRLAILIAGVLALCAIMWFVVLPPFFSPVPMGARVTDARADAAFKVIPPDPPQAAPSSR